MTIRTRNQYNRKSNDIIILSQNNSNQILSLTHYLHCQPHLNNTLIGILQKSSAKVSILNVKEKSIKGKSEIGDTY